MKRDRYLALVAARKSCRACAGLRNPADQLLRVYDSDEIGPWTRLHGDLNARLMVVGQDWGDVNYYSRNAGLDDPSNPTNAMLDTLLDSVGFPGGLRDGLGPRGVFLTNAILCLKQGGLQSQVERQWFSNCGTRFLGPLIELVSPRVVVALGERAYGTVLGAFGFRPSAFRQAVESERGTALPNGTTLLAVYHCGRRIQNTHRPAEEQLRDWGRVARALAEPAPMPGGRSQ